MLCNIGRTNDFCLVDILPAKKIDDSRYIYIYIYNIYIKRNKRKRKEKNDLNFCFNNYILLIKKIESIINNNKKPRNLKKFA